MSIPLHFLFVMFSRISKGERRQSNSNSYKMLLKEALAGNGFNHVYSVRHLDFMGILFYTNNGNKQHFLSVKIHLVQLEINLQILELPLAMVVSILETDIGIAQLGAVKILQHCCLFVLVGAKGWC